MSNGDYFVGQPECPVETKEKPEVKVNGEQKPVTTPGGYYVGKPTTDPPEPPMPTEPAANNNGSGFFSKWFPCFAPNGASE